MTLYVGIEEFACADTQSPSRCRPGTDAQVFSLQVDGRVDGNADLGVTYKEAGYACQQTIVKFHWHHDTFEIGVRIGRSKRIDGAYNLL